jgi:hypothetical protein
MEFKSRKMVVISFWVRTRMQIEFSAKRLSSDCEASPHAFIQLVRVAQRTENSQNGGCLTVTIWRSDSARQSTLPQYPTVCLFDYTSVVFEGSKLHSSVGWEPPKLPTGND